MRNVTINDWKNVYKENYRLDKIWEQKFKNNEPEYRKKECIAFLVELGELINETKCFKFWSIKKANRENVLEELADCIIVVLYFYGELSMPMEYNKNHKNISNILDLINYLFTQGTKLIDELNKELVTNIFEHLMYLSELLDIKECEVIDSINKKHKIIEERLNSEY